MEVITSDFLESSIYRILFECVQEEGVDAFLKLMQDIYNIPNKNLLVYEAIKGRKSSLDELKKNNKKILDYLNEVGLNGYNNQLMIKLIMNDDTFKILKKIASDGTLLELYLNNAKKIENLKVERVVFGNIRKFNTEERRYYCDFKKLNNMTLKYVYKCFTDGRVYPEMSIYEACDFSWMHQGYNAVPFEIDDNQPYSFVLTTENKENKHQKRTIDIEDFGFDGSKLPTEEEVSSYEIPKALIKK